MYIYHRCVPESKNSYNERYSKSHLSSLIKTFDLRLIGKCKEYCLNTIQIISRKNKLLFQSISDTDITYENGWLRQNCDIREIPPFHFYNVDSEESFQLYESTFKGHLLQLREFDEYVTWTIHTPYILSISDMKLFYI
jgi:hypothetical protein